MLVRVITLLLAVMMMTATAAHACASPDVTSEIDDAPDLDAPVLPVLPAQVAAPQPDDSASICIEAPRARGRLHAVFVFRPPRLVASR